MAHGTFEAHEEFLATFGQGSFVVVGENLPRRRGQETDESGHFGDLLQADFRIRCRVGVWGDRSAVDGLLHRRERRRYSHLQWKRSRVEIQQSRHGSLATEPPNASIN